MNALQEIRARGQSIWLDNITRELLSSGTLSRYIQELGVTGLTSNPTIFQQAISKSDAYNNDIATLAENGDTAEVILFELAISDLKAAASLLHPVYEATDAMDGFVSLEVSPLLAFDTARTIEAAAQLHSKAATPNLFIKIPGTEEGLPAIENSIFAGIPINVTLLFSREQYLNAAEAYLRGIERRIDAGLDPGVASVASVFVSRWDAAVSDRVPDDLRNGLGIAMAARTYTAYCDLLKSPRWERAINAGARPQRLLFASTGTKDPKASDMLYVRALTAPNTVNTMPEATLLATADHGEVHEMLTPNSEQCEAMLSSYAKAGIDLDDVASTLQTQGAALFSKSWQDLLAVIKDRVTACLLATH